MLSQSDREELRSSVAPEMSPLSSTPHAASAHPVISNTTPLITLGALGLLDVMRQLYGSLWIPPSGHAEYQRGRARHPQQPDLQPLTWMIVKPPQGAFVLPPSLDAGERDAIALALAAHASRILLDERHARTVAAQFGLTVTGSAGVLLAAKQTGLIPLIKPILEQLVAQGRYISPSLYDLVLKQAGE